MSDGKDDDRGDNAKPEKKKKGRRKLRSLASLGGEARAAKLSAEQRSAIAKKGAEERWARASGLPQETHVGVIHIGDISLPCAVLDNKMRVFSHGGLSRAFGSKKTGANKPPDPGSPQLPPFLAAENVKGSISEDLMARLNSPVLFRSKQGGGTGYGIPAEALPLVCEAIMDAYDSGRLKSTQKYLVDAAKAMHRGFARVGIVALVDEATGYQADRARDELQRLLEAFVAEELRPWVKLFPDRFFRQVYRLHGWKYEAGNTQGPRYVGKFINKYVYERLPPEVFDELRRRNPVINEKGQRRHKHFQFLTDDIGHPAIDRHLASVTTLMSVSKDKDHFSEMFSLAFPRVGEQLVIVETVQPPQLPQKPDA